MEQIYFPDNLLNIDEDQNVSRIFYCVPRSSLSSTTHIINLESNLGSLWGQGHKQKYMEAKENSKQ